MKASIITLVCGGCVVVGALSWSQRDDGRDEPATKPQVHAAATTAATGDDTSRAVASFAARDAARRRAARGETRSGLDEPAALAHAGAGLIGAAEASLSSPRPVPRPLPPPTFADAAAETRWYEAELVSAQTRARRLGKLAERMDETDSRALVRERIGGELAQTEAYIRELQAKLDDLGGTPPDRAGT